MCTNLPDCWVGALSEGLRGGDIGGFMDPRSPTDPKFYVQVAHVLTYVFTYWPTFLLTYLLTYLLTD